MNKYQNGTEQNQENDRSGQESQGNWQNSQAGWQNQGNWQNSQAGWQNQGNWQSNQADWQNQNAWQGPAGRRLVKSTNRMVCGVCAGIAEYFGWDPTVVRILWVVISLLLGAGMLGLIAYFVVAVIMPEV